MRIRIVLLVSLLLFEFSALATAQTRRSTPPDSASLRSSFLATFGSDFELVRDKITSRTNEQGGGTFWLAYVKARQPGYFTLKYSFNRDDKHYSHEERDISFTVAPRGCRRGPPLSGVYARFCLGDTIIVPVLLSGGSGFEFKLTKQAPKEDEDWLMFSDRYPGYRDHELDKTPVENSSESLRYVGRRANKMLHRSLGYTLHLLAEFEAVKPGKFNLLVTSSSQSADLDEPSPGSRAIIVVDRNTPVTLIAGREQVRGFTMGPDGREYQSSTSGNSYMTSLIVLQPGDRISLQYLSLRRSGNFERRTHSGVDNADPDEKTKPVISVHPFALETRYDFGAWLADYLP